MVIEPVISLAVIVALAVALTVTVDLIIWGPLDRRLRRIAAEHEARRAERRKEGTAA